MPASQSLLSSPMERVSEFAVKQVLNIMSLSGKRLSVLIFHRVLSELDDLREDEPDISRFRQQMDWVNRSFNVIPLSEGIRRIQENSLKPRSLCITFDDGYEDNLLNAVPVLLEFGLPACFFITTAYVDGGMMWNDVLTEAVRYWPQDTMQLADFGLPELATDSLQARRSSLLQLNNHYKYMETSRREAETQAIYTLSGGPAIRMMMDAEQIKALSETPMEIGGHTHSHPILTRIDAETARIELKKNYSLLSEITSKQPTLFAYPNGKPGRDYTAEHVEIVRETGYQSAVTTAWGTMSESTDSLQIPRFTPWDRSKQKFLLRMAHNYLRKAERCEDFLGDTTGTTQQDSTTTSC